MLDTSDPAITAALNGAADSSAADQHTPNETRRPRSGRPGTGKRWGARLLVLLMLVGAVLGGIRLSQYRSAQQARIDLGTVTLTARSTPVSTLSAGVVKQVAVQAHESVVAGQNLGTLTVLKASAADPANLVPGTVTIKAPSDGVVAADPLPVGSSLQPGQPFVQLYDPMTFTLVATVPIQKLSHVGAGMQATLRAPGIGHPIHAMVERVVPRVSTDGTSTVPSGKKSMQLVLSPVPAADVASLVPGFQFTGYVSGDPSGTPSRGVLGVS